MIKGVIFDFNGTLFWDSEKHLEAWREFSKRIRPYPFTDDEMREHMFGHTNEDIIGYLLGKKPDPELVEKLGQEKEAVYREMCRKDMGNTHLASGAEEFLDYLKENNIPMAIATMSEKSNVDFYIETFNLKKWFDIENIAYSDGTLPGKPAPDIFIKAAKKLGLHPSECVVFEDAVAGLEAAHLFGAGMIVAIASMESDELYKQIPYVDMVVHDFREVGNTLKITAKLLSE